MQFTVAPQVFARFPGLRLPVAVAGGVDNSADNPQVLREWQDAWTRAAEVAGIYGNAQSHPRVQPWRARFRAMGVSGKEFPSSVEALVRRALKGGEPFRINPLVDFYNTISLRHTVPAGGFDLEQIEGPLELRHTRAGDTFASLEREASVMVPPGEVAYAAGQMVLTRHFVWRQARTGLITPATRAVFLVAEVLHEVGEGVAEAVRDDFCAGLRLHFGVSPRGFVVDAERAAISW